MTKVYGYHGIICFQDYPPTTSAYINLVGRVLIQNPNFFFTFLEQLATQLQQTVSIQCSTRLYPRVNKFEIDFA